VKRVEGGKGSQHAIAWTQGGNPAPAVAQAPCADRYPCVDTRADATLDRPLGGAILRATRWTTEYLGYLQVPDRSRVYSERERASASEQLESDRDTNSWQQDRPRDRTCASCGEAGSRHHGQEPTHHRCACAAEQSLSRPDR
jgi:hypothetical protein